jgi:hypothetical protein
MDEGKVENSSCSEEPAKLKAKCVYPGQVSINHGTYRSPSARGITAEDTGTVADENQDEQ